MMTMTQTHSNTFQVTVDGQWAGDVWSAGQWWVAMDFDGDTEPGFDSMLSAARFVREMRRHAR